ncbi:MAG: FG-GAP repeat protein [Fibrobacterota bacterium]|nr:FG-GAP repeat protein [Fibrobacterota bacterium]QQS06138.1 MAG: FG-GAP repeat protein [Fibrobacterota bacterium]
MTRTFQRMIATAAFLAASAGAAIPGLFVVQEGRTSDPVASALTLRTDFGFAQLAPIGDINKDKVQDLIAGAPYLDSGAVQILLMNSAGKLAAAPTTINARHPLLKPTMGTSPDNFGAGMGVVLPFSDSRSCAVVMTSSVSFRKLWALKICRDQTGAPNGIDLTQAVVFDTAHAAFSGLGLKGLGFGNSMSVLDTLTTGERLVAIGSTLDGLGKRSEEGRVILLAIHPTTLALRRVTAFPENWTTDPFAANLQAGEHFGSSIAPWRGANGKKGMVVVSPDWTDAGGTYAGRVSIVTFGDDNKFFSISSFSGMGGDVTTGAVFSVASGDIDHDGVTDLALGYNLARSAGVTQIGMVKILLLNGSGVPKDSSFIGKGSSGFVDTANALGVDCQWGSKVSLVDLDGDQQLDLVAGARGNAVASTPEIVGSVWALRLKQRPWRHKSPDSILLAGTGWVQRVLSDYVTGNNLKWSIVPPAVPGPDPVATCRVSGAALATVVECQAGTSNGITKVRVVAKDTGNIPATVQYTDTLEFPVRVSGINNPPVQTKTLPTIVLTEDHADTAVVVFSKFFSDPEAKPLTVTVTGYDGTITSLLTFHQSANFDTLFIAPVQFKFGNGSLRVVIKDDFGSSVEAKLDIQVTHVNHLPVANSDEFEVFENLATSLDVVANDKDDDKETLVPVIVAAPSHGKAVVVGSKVMFTPDSFYTGDDAFTYKADDKTGLSAVASVKVKVKPYQGTPVVFRPLKDVTVPEDSPPILIHADSLFFSGADRFQYEIFLPIHNCQSLADVTFDSKTKILTLAPFKYQSGQCDITLRDYLPAKDSVASKMTLTVTFVEHPYKFSSRILLDTVSPGNRHVVKLDSLDLDRKELEYVFGAGWPAWAAVDGRSIVLNPPMDAVDFYATLMVRKKVGAGETPSVATDTVDFQETVQAISALRGRKMGGLRLDFASQPGKLIVRNGPDAFRLELFSLKGERFVTMTGEPFQERSIDLPAAGSTVYLRLQEGGRTTIAPLLMNH